MKNKEEKKNRIWVPIVIGALACSAAVGTGIALAHNQQRPKAGTVATMSDAADFSGLTTEVAEVTTEEATTEAALEVVSNESKKPEAVPATTEIGGGKKKAEETTEEKKPSTTESTKPSTNHSNSGNSGSASSGQSTTPKPSNSGSNSGGNSGNSGSGNSGSSNSTSSPKPSTPATTEAPAAQHQHNYNVWVKTKDAWDEEVIDQAAYDEIIEHPAEYKMVPAVRCNTCYQKFTSYTDFDAHATYGGGSCTADGHGTTAIYIMTKDAWTETKHHDEKSHVVHHDEEGYWKCECGARE